MNVFAHNTDEVVVYVFPTRELTLQSKSHSHNLKVAVNFPLLTLLTFQQTCFNLHQLLNLVN